MKLFRTEWAERSDAQLLRAVASGEPEALAALYDRHAGWLHVRLSRRCADRETVRRSATGADRGPGRPAAARAGRRSGAPYLVRHSGAALLLPVARGTP